MAVVINDFEVVTESAPGEKRGAPGAREEDGEAGSTNAPAALTANDMRRFVHRQLERVERIRAD